MGSNNLFYVVNDNAMKPSERINELYDKHALKYVDPYADNMIDAILKYLDEEYEEVLELKMSLLGSRVKAKECEIEALALKNPGSSSAQKA